MSEKFQNQIIFALDSLSNELENSELNSGRYNSATYHVSTAALPSASAPAEATNTVGVADSNQNTEAVIKIAKDLIELQRSLSRVSQTAAKNSSSPTQLSSIEQAILRSTVPIDINETEEITINGITGLLANRQEINNWRGDLPLSKYQINEDANPEIITKVSSQKLEYVQELAIRYLRPPTPPAPGEIIINQEANIVAAPAPPLVLRQQPPRPCTPEPLVIREAPPQPPQQVGRKVITISGKRLPPPPRKVVIERLAPLPSKPQSVIVERWLPYSQVKRRVIFNRNCSQEPVVLKPKNIIVQWESPEVLIKKEFKYLGVIRANPAEYVQRFGSTLKVSAELPDFVTEIKTPEGLVLAADHQPSSLYELEGDVQALKLVDLEKEGLAEYKSFIENFQNSTFNSSSLQYNSVSLNSVSAQNEASAQKESSSAAVYSSMPTVSSSSNTSTTSSAQLSQLTELVEHIFHSIDRDGSGKISIEEAEKVLLRLNSRLGRSYGEDDVKALFTALDFNNDNSLDLNEFKTAFLNLAYTA